MRTHCLRIWGSGVWKSGMWELGFRELRFAPGIGKWELGIRKLGMQQYSHRALAMQRLSFQLKQNRLFHLLIHCCSHDNVKADESYISRFFLLLPGKWELRNWGIGNWDFGDSQWCAQSLCFTSHRALKNTFFPMAPELTIPKLHANIAAETGNWEFGNWNSGFGNSRIRIWNWELGIREFWNLPAVRKAQSRHKMYSTKDVFYIQTHTHTRQ